MNLDQLMALWGIGAQILASVFSAFGTVWAVLLAQKLSDRRHWRESYRRAAREFEIFAKLELSQALDALEESIMPGAIYSAEIEENAVAAVRRIEYFRNDILASAHAPLATIATEVVDLALMRLLTATLTHKSGQSAKSKADDTGWILALRAFRRVLTEADKVKKPEYGLHTESGLF